MKHILFAILSFIFINLNVLTAYSNDEISVLNTESINFNSNYVQEYDSWQIPLMIKVNESYGFPYMPTLQFRPSKFNEWFDLKHYEGKIKKGSFLCVWYSDIISQLGAQYVDYLGSEFSFRIVWTAYGYPEKASNIVLAKFCHSIPFEYEEIPTADGERHHLRLTLNNKDDYNCNFVNSLCNFAYYNPYDKKEDEAWNKIGNYDLLELGIGVYDVRFDMSEEYNNNKLGMQIQVDVKNGEMAATSNPVKKEGVPLKSPVTKINIDTISTEYVASSDCYSAILEITDGYYRFPYQMTNTTRDDWEKKTNIYPTSVLSIEQYRQSTEFQTNWKTERAKLESQYATELKKRTQLKYTPSLPYEPMSFGCSKYAVALPMYIQENGKCDVFFMWAKNIYWDQYKYESGRSDANWTIHGLDRMTNVPIDFYKDFISSYNNGNMFHFQIEDLQMEPFEVGNVYSSSSEIKYTSDPNNYLKEIIGEIEINSDESYITNYTINFVNGLDKSSFMDDFEHNNWGSVSILYYTDIYEFVTINNDYVHNGNYILVKDVSGSTVHNNNLSSPEYKLIKFFGADLYGDNEAINIVHEFPFISKLTYAIIKTDGSVLYYDGDNVYYYDKSSEKTTTFPLKKDQIGDLINGGFDSDLGCYYFIYKDRGPYYYRQNMITTSAVKPSVKTIEEWETSFLNTEYVKYLENQDFNYKLDGLISNRDETFTLVDADGCETEFDVYVKTKQIEATSMLATWNGSSYDYKMTVKYLDMGTMWDEGKKQSATRGNTMEISGLSQNGTLTFIRELSSTDSDKFTYDYDFGTGITNVQATYCKEAGGTLLVTYTPQTANDKLMLFKDGTKLEGKTITTTEKEKGVETSYKFSDLEEGTYTVKAVSGVKTFVWSPITLSSYTFAIDSDKTKTFATNVTAIEGEDGVCSVTVNNAIGDVTWTWNGTTEKDNTSTTLSKEGLPANSYKVTATQNGCKDSTTFNINAPAIVGKVEIRQSNDTLYCSLSDVVKNDSVADGYSVVLKNGQDELPCKKITSQSDKPSSFVIDSDSNNGVYNIVLKYRKPGDTADKEWKIGEFKIAGDTLVGYSLAHKIDTTKPTCYNQNNSDLKFTLNPKKAKDDNTVFESNLNGEKFVDSEDTKTINNTVLGNGVDAVSYQVKSSASETKTDDNNESNKLTFGSDNSKHTSSFNISYCRSADYKITGLSKYHVDSLKAEVIPNDFLCSYSDITDVVIDTIKGGFSKDVKIQYHYDFINSDIKTKYQSASTDIKGLKDTISVKDSGNYTIYIKDSRHGCVARNLGTYHIARPAPLEFATFTPNDPICELMANGSFEVKATGGIPAQEGYRYFVDTLNFYWDTTKNQYGELEYPKPHSVKEDSTVTTDAAKFEGYYPGKYKITVFDSNQCMASATPTLNYYYNPRVIEADTVPVSCHGMKDGQINVLSARGTSKIKSFQLYDGETLLTECDFSDTLSQNKSNAHNDNDYSWSAIDKRGNKVPLYIFDTLYSKGYNLALTDIKGCVTNYSGKTIPDNKKKEWYYVDVTQPDPLKLSFPSQNTIIPEYGKPGGNVEVYVTGGNKGRFGIFLHDSIMPDSIGNAVDSIPILLEKFYPGLHILSVKDHKGCADTTTTGKFIQPDAPLTFTATTKIGLCNGAPDSVKIVPSGGWGRYRYTNLLAKDTVEAVNVKTDTVGLDSAMHIFLLSAGTYKVSVIDAAGVVYSEYVTIESQDSLVALPVTKPATCKNDGYIGVDIKGGSAPYKVFAYDFGFNDTLKTEDIVYKEVFSRTFPAGAYTVATVDKNNCRVLTNVEVRDTNVTVSVIKEFPGLRQYAGGSLEAIASRGVNPYTYLWTNMYTGETSTEKKWSGLYAGVYQIEVKDAVGCDVQKIVKLPTNGDMPLKTDTVTNETGVDKNDGTARFTSDTTGFVRMVLFSDRNDSIVYDTVHSGMQFELTKLAPGSYVLECRLPKGESRYAEFSIAKYELINLLVTNIMKVTRPGYDDGSANVHIDGGEGPFNIQILKGDDFYADTLLANSRVLAMEQLEAGTYHIRVEDRYGKRSDVTAIIAEPEKMLALKVTSITNPYCYGETNGEVAVEAEGGWGNYEYAEIDSAFSRLSTYTSRKAETYTFVVKDEAGVTDTLSVTLSQPDSLRASLVSVDSVSCFGRFDGSATFSIKGGVAPYTIKLDSLFPYKDTVIGSLNAGYHRFWFVDDHFCNSHDSIVAFIPQPERLQITGAQVVHTTCDTDNGRITITVGGGTQPYSYSWDEDGHSKSKFNGLSSIDGLIQNALYKVNVVDANGCATDNSYRINESTNPKISYVSTMPVLCYGDTNGTAMLDSSNITAATPYAPFRIEWPHGQNQMLVNDLAAGRHTVWVIDTNNCKGSASFEIGTPPIVQLTKLGSRDASCFGYSDGAINVMTYGGVGNFTYLWNTGHTLSKLDSIPKGTYTVIVADKNNCRDSATYSISQPDSIHVEIGEDTVLMCPENEYPLAASKNFASYKWYLDDSLMFDTRKVSVSDGGEYHLVATYGANCIARDTVTVIIGDDLLKADFYMASDASIDTTIALVELSNMKVDSLRWDFSQDDFEVIDETAYEIYLKPYNLGIHPVTLWAYSSGCVSYITKEVEIVELAENSDSISLGYNPMIRSITVVPNPTSGKFTVDLDLREVDDVSLSIAESGSGTVVESRNLTGKAKYEETFDISNHVGGTFLINVQSGSDRRTAKIMLVK